MLFLQENGEDWNEDVPEMASLSNRFSFFENFETKEQEKKKKGGFRMTPPREGADGDEEGAGPEWKTPGTLLTEADMARKECKARSILNKFKDMEKRVLNGEEEGRNVFKIIFDIR